MQDDKLDGKKYKSASNVALPVQTRCISILFPIEFCITTSYSKAAFGEPGRPLQEKAAIDFLTDKKERKKGKKCSQWPQTQVPFNFDNVFLFFRPDDLDSSPPLEEPELPLNQAAEPI